MPRCLMVVDQPIDNDRRVQACIEAYEAQGWAVELWPTYKPLAQGRQWAVDLVLAAPFLLSLVARCCGHALRIAPRFFRFCKSRNIAKYRLKKVRLPKSFWRETLVCAFKGFRASRHHRTAFAHYDILHAHDLKSLSFSQGVLQKNPAISLVYDAHELSAFRNRKHNSLLCALLTTAYERTLSHPARLVVSVSSPCLAYLKLFAKRSSPAAFRLVCNDFYHHCETLAFSPMSRRQAMIYIGSLASGRGLPALLALKQKQPDLDLLLYCPEDNPAQRKHAAALSGNDGVCVHFGAYEQDIRARCQHYQAAAGWLCLDDLCLSYRFSLSNKFFQYIRFGLPIVYRAGFHTADLLNHTPVGMRLDAMQGASGRLNIPPQPEPDTLPPRVQRLMHKTYARALGPILR